jgi:hypothetical protein
VAHASLDRLIRAPASRAEHWRASATLSELTLLLEWVSMAGHSHPRRKDEKNIEAGAHIVHRGYRRSGTRGKLFQTDRRRWVPQVRRRVPKSAFASTVASRAYSSASNTVYGGFELSPSSTVYILVRGNSLGNLSITNGYLDAPHVRLFNSAGQDLISQNGFAGFNDCSASNTSTDLPVVNYYAARGIPVDSRDTCLATFASAGSYTFTVTPSFLNVNSSLRASGNSGPSNGEVLFEVKLGP